MGSILKQLKETVFTKANLQRLLLVFGLWLYCLFGAACFHSIEGTAEKALNYKEKQTYNELLSNYSQRPLSNCTLMIDNVYTLTINNVIQSPTQTKPTKFDFYGSFYFSTTVVTTIGFGNTAPTTKTGRTFCIFYALFGIPFCLITLNKVSDFFAWFRSLFLRRTKSKLVKTGIMFLITTWWVFALIIIPSACFTSTEGWELNTGLYFSFVTLSTIGFGDYVATGATVSAGVKNFFRFIFFLWTLLGLAYISNLISAIQNDMQDTFEKITDKLCCRQDKTRVVAMEPVKNDKNGILPPSKY